MSLLNKTYTPPCKRSVHGPHSVRISIRNKIPSQLHSGARQSVNCRAANDDGVIGKGDGDKTDIDLLAKMLSQQAAKLRASYDSDPLVDAAADAALRGVKYDLTPSEMLTSQVWGQDLTRDIYRDLTTSLMAYVEIW
jgi:hypothetical protein